MTQLQGEPEKGLISQRTYGAFREYRLMFLHLFMDNSALLKPVSLGHVSLSF